MIGEKTSRNRIEQRRAATADSSTTEATGTETRHSQQVQITIPL